MEEKEIDCVERFMKEMEEYGYRFFITVKEEPSTLEQGKMDVRVELAVRKSKPRDKSSWCSFIGRFYH